VNTDTTTSAPRLTQAQADHRFRRSDLLAAPLRLLTHRIAGKLVLPYLVVLSLVLIVLTYFVSELLSSSLEEKFRDELAGAGRSANEAMVLLEDRHLTILRQMAFTEDVDTALANRDTNELQALLAPIAVNSRTPYVDVLSAEGTQLLALRSRDVGADASALLDPNVREWGPIRDVLAERADRYGDKFAGVVAAPWGRLFVSATPVYLNEQVVGVVAVATPIDEVAKRLSQEAGGKGITLYDRDGTPIASTLRATSTALVDALTLPQDQINTVTSATQVIMRRATLGDLLYLEALGVIAIRREPALILGTGDLLSIIGERGAQTRAMMVAATIAVGLLVLLIGTVLARRITRPVYTLRDATARVLRNELDSEVEVQSKDELGTLAFAFNEMQGGLRERERARVAIERYMSPKVYRLIQAGGLKMGGESREITVFKTDIRDFTTLSERMEPQALVEFLNRYFEAMVAAIAKYDGEVDKYMGDAILAKFGATEWYPDHARRAVLAMIEMIEACDRFAGELRPEGMALIRMGIGANTGEAVVGNIGSSERMEYTIISDAVNTAQRIEELCKELGWDLLISEHTYVQAKDAIEVGRPWSTRLRGQTRDIQIYPVLGRAGEVPRHRREAYEALVARRLVGKTASA
jgi:adenylate cyclase